ncbi:MAG: hypothetical protein RL326_2094, partial [Pseudomonadota bacterium]
FAAQHLGEDVLREISEDSDVFQITRDFHGDPFEQCLTLPLKEALDSLTAPYGREPASDYGRWGWWSINRSYGLSRKWVVPKEGWHWDGAAHLHSATHCHGVGILMLCLFSDVMPRGGATLVAEGTHRAVARALWGREPMALASAIKSVRDSNPWIAALTGHDELRGNGDAFPVDDDARTEFFFNSYYDPSTRDRYRVIEATGAAGDVYLCHPFLFHAASYNHRQVPRFLCNRTAPFLGPLVTSKHSLSTGVLDRILNASLSSSEVSCEA